MALNRNVPFYLQVVSILRNEIISGKFLPGNPLPQEEELAARFEVSKDVIRVSLRMLAEDGLIIRIRSKGTFVCENLNSNNRRILLTVCQNPVAVDLLRHGAERGAAKGKYDLVLKKVHPFDLAAEQRCMKTVKHSDFAAMVVTPAIAPDDSDNRELYSKYIRYGVPVIAIDHEFTDIPVDIVCFDEYGSMRAVAEECLQTVPGKTAFFLRKMPHRIARRRNQALKEVAWGLPSHSKCVFEVSAEGFDEDSIVDDFFCQLEKSGFIPDSILVDNNVYGFKLFERMQENEKFKSLKIIGTVGDTKFGNNDFNSRLLCHYRLYDDFIEPLEEILSLRLENRMPVGMSMVRMIKFRPMTSEQISSYFIRALQPDYTGFL